MADIFADDSLFSEFDRDRDAQNIFINFDQDEAGSENRSRIVFTAPLSDEEASDEEDLTDNGKEPSKPTPGAEAARQNPQSGSSKGKASDFFVDDDEFDEEARDGSADNGSGGEVKVTQPTAYQVHHEKTKLRQFAQLIDSTRMVSDDQSPGVQLVFHNNKFAKKYRGRIEQFIISLAQHADKKDFAKAAIDLSTKRTVVPTCVDINDKLPTEKRNNRMWQAHGVIGCAQFHSGFMVDSRGWLYDENEPSEVTNADIPKYSQVFSEVFPAEESETAVAKPSKPKDSCFNCGGDHRLNECVAPKDHSRIRAKRREHQEAAKSSNPGRYHEDPELDPQKAKFMAGVISDSLREAIGLKSEQLPPYIYRMRLFGYPPGWLMEANRKTSALAMYDKHGRETNLRGESLEDGEYGEQASSDAAALDPNRIIEYPGFTVPVPLGFIDESESIGMPAIQQHQLKKTLVEDMVAKETAKKRRLEEMEKEKNKKMKTEDMDDVEDGTKPEAVKTSTPSGDDKGKESKETGEGREDGTASPSMDSLQQEYKNLVEQLDSEGDSSVTNGASMSSSTDKTPSKSELFREKNFSFTSSTSISKDFGTPILVRDKSFKSLPSPEKFSQGVEDHIPFENLPDSVGTFEKMRNLFAAIRNKIKKGKK